MAQKVLVSTKKGLFIFKLDGDQSQCIGHYHSGIPVTAACVDATGAIWSCFDHGHWSVKISRSQDEGQSWQEIASPKYPKDAVYANWGQENIPAVLKYIWTIEPLAQQEGVLVGTIPGGLFRWQQGEWQLDQGLWGHPSRNKWFGGGMDDPGIHSIIINPDNADHLMVALSCAGIFETTNGGQSWETRNQGMQAGFLPDPEADREVGYDPHRVVRSESDPLVLWQQNHVGIYVSRDGAHSWQSVSTADTMPHFGFAIIASPTDPGTAWVLPGQSDEIRIAPTTGLCLYRTDDFGQTWSIQNRGLPSPAYDICYRHAMDIQQQTIVFGSTTGNLYFTDDGGQQFHTISTNLPPILSVDFYP